MLKIKTLSKFEEIFSKNNQIKLYGAGFYLSFLLTEIDQLDKSYLEKISCIIVSNKEGNPDKVLNIPVYNIEEANIHSQDDIILTLGEGFVEEVVNKLKVFDANIYHLDFNLFQEKPYAQIKESIQPFIDNFSKNESMINLDTYSKNIKAWSCWWQGENEAPDIVKACWGSQRRNLPDSVEHVIITRDNYSNYIQLPNYILEKVENGYITLITLSDIVRASLLYKYGGFWLDSTLLINEKTCVLSI